MALPWYRDDELLVERAVASVQGRVAFGERAGESGQRVGLGTQDEPFVKGPLCAVDGFSLRAGQRLPQLNLFTLWGWRPRV